MELPLSKLTGDKLRMFNISNQNLFPASKVHIEIKIKVEWTGKEIYTPAKNLLQVLEYKMLFQYQKMPFWRVELKNVINGLVKEVLNDKNTDSFDVHITL